MYDRAKEQQKEIATIKERTIHLNLSDADCKRISTYAAEERTDFILAENRKDLNRMDTSNPKYDRLMLTPERLKGIATDIRITRDRKSVV